MKTIAMRTRIIGACASLFLLLSILSACSKESDGGKASDAGLPDGRPADASVTDGGAADASAGDAGDAGVGPRVAPEVEPEPLAVGKWTVTVVSLEEADPIGDELLKGEFQFPEPGTDSHGLRWWKLEQQEGGVLGDFPYAIVYAAVKVDLEKPARLIARSDNSIGVYINGVLQPGDIYGSRRIRVPLVGQEGENVIVLRAIGGRGLVEIELFKTEDEAFFNLADLTLPDLVAGEEEENGLYAGVPVLNLTDAPILDASAKVLENEYFEAASIEYPALPAAAVTQVAFLLRPKSSFTEAGATVPARLHLESPSLGWMYEREISLSTVAADAVRRCTFRSADDGSVQYYGVLPPSQFDPQRDYALVLSLHGAGVEAAGQAGAYSAKDWAYIVAPTNRRPFGFDWEEWGHFNAILALDDAMARFRIDPARVYLTGHSMGGHGTWHVGVMHPGRFATIGPSAGWSSFYSYAGEDRPTGPFGRARAQSDTLLYLENLARRGIYIIHGSADDNVPVTEGRRMNEAAREVCDDVVYHEEPGAGHWWDGDAAPGADCVDWPPLFEFMQQHALDPYELEFKFKSPAPSYTAVHSFATLQSAVNPNLDLALSSLLAEDGSLTITTENVRSMTLDGAALRGKGVTRMSVDGAEIDVPDGPLPIGPTEGKNRNVYGPFNQVFRRPFCFVYPEDGDPYSQYVSYMASEWSVTGNGSACALPLSRLTDEILGAYNIIYVGVPPDAVSDLSIPFGWDEGGASYGERRYDGAGLLFVFPQRGHLSAVLAAPAASEWLLYSIMPFCSRCGFPDYLFWKEGRGIAAGIFDGDWQ